jgi:hypothetical protein
LGDGWQRKRVTPCKSSLVWVRVQFYQPLLNILLSLVAVAVLAVTL